jgi:CRISPR-associated protein Csx17
VLRLVSEQADGEARGWWGADRFLLRSSLQEEQLLEFFLATYSPTPILAPWNGGSGFYPKDRKVGIDAIAESTDCRFTGYREAISFLRGLPEIADGKAEKSEEKERRTRILQAARNWLPDSAVEWLDAAVGLAADGERSFAPVLGTGGNEGRLDYTNNFMERLAELLILQNKKTPVRELLRNALFGSPTNALQPAAVGQFDPGRAGGFNQGAGIATPDVPVNPWDFVLTLEGAVAWASGVYRRHGVAYRSLLCSPFTVYANAVGYGSSSGGDEARAELWTPIWRRPTRYAELRTLLREGRASVGREPAGTGMQFAEAATSLGVDRGITAFVRYDLLKRRGDSYIALPTGLFPVGYSSASDRIRELQALLDPIEVPDAAKALLRKVDVASYEALLRGGSDRLRAVMAALGRLLRWLGRTGNTSYIRRDLDAAQWIADCGSTVEVRIAAALASIDDRRVGGIREHLFSAGDHFAWSGRNLPDRMIGVLEKRLRLADAAGCEYNPVGGSCEIRPGDATIFIEGSVDDDLIEDLLFAFTCLNWRGYDDCPTGDTVPALPVYIVLKHLFLASTVEVGGERKRLRSDARVLSLLRANDIEGAAGVALHRLRVAGLNPLKARYLGGVDALRLAASLLIPIRTGASFSAAVLNDREEKETYS